MHVLLNSQQRMSGRARFGCIRHPAGAHGWNTDNQYLFITTGLSVGGSKCYIGILLGPERTRECFFQGKNMQAGDRIPIAELVVTLIVV